MENFIVVEVGSTTTKAYLYDGEVKKLDSVVIEFKNNFKKNNKIFDTDKGLLFDFVNNLKNINQNIYVYGTSIFRNLDEKAKNIWLKEFSINTNLNFNIVTSTMENEYTVYGAIANTNYDGNIAVMIGGGGSTELSISNKGDIIESCNYSFGAMDTTDMFLDIKGDLANSNYEYMVLETKKLISSPQNKADILILAGGDYIYFYEELGYEIPKNKFYNNELQPYALNLDLMDEIDRDFFYKISLEEIIKRTNNEGWWRGARGMRLCVKALCDILEVKYIIPTRINMVYGIVNEILKGK